MTNHRIRLLVFTNCNAKEKMNYNKTKIEFKNKQNKIVEWKPLTDKTSIGCGINSLTFLGVFTRELGIKLVNNINFTGTSFIEMMYYLKEISDKPTNLKEYVTDVTTVEKLTDFLNTLFSEMPENTCVIAKLNRGQDILGHSVIFSKQKEEGVNTLYTIDPQLGSIKKRDPLTSDIKIFNAWNKDPQHKFISVSLIFEESLPNSIISPIKVKKITFPQLNRISLIQKQVIDEQINSWLVLDQRPTQKYDCSLGVLTFFNFISRDEGVKLAKQFNNEKRGMSFTEMIIYLNKIKPIKSINVVQQYDNNKEFIDNLNKELNIGYGTIIQIRALLSNNTYTGHYVVARKIDNNVFQIFDPQLTTLFNSFDEFYNSYITPYNLSSTSSAKIDAAFLYYNIEAPTQSRSVIKKSKHRRGTYVSFKLNRTKKTKYVKKSTSPNSPSVPMEIDPTVPIVINSPNNGNVNHLTNVPIKNNTKEISVP